MQRRCCNAPTDPGPLTCQPCATPISPCTQTDYTLRVEAWGVSGVSNGTGMLCAGDGQIAQEYIPDQGLDCMIGECGTTPYTRKKVFVEDWYASDAVCIDRQNDMCADMTSTGQPQPQFGWHELRWRGCAAPNEQNIYYDDQSDAVRITGMFLDRRWCSTSYPCTGAYCYQTSTQCHHVPVGLCDDPEEFDGCMTIIEVAYEFSDGAEFGNWHRDANDVCVRSTTYVSLTQEYRCVYGRRNAANEKVAVGQYKLLSASVDPFPTYKSNGYNQTGSNCCRTCLDPSTISACAPNYASAPVTLNTPWKPPQFITVARSC